MPNRKDKKRFNATTPARRFMKLASMSTSIATRVAVNQTSGLFKSDEAKQRDKDRLIADIGQQVAETLGEMKGAVMKVGQIASQMQDLLPPDFAQALAKLQTASPPMPFNVISRQILKELGGMPEDLFKEFNEVPFAAASIGQVHRATTHEGQEVVVKIQYPGVEDSIDSDLKQLRRILKLGGLLKIDEQALDGVYTEIREQLKEELNYCLEAENLRQFGQLHADDKDVIIPSIIDDLSSTRVLTLSLEQGNTLEETLSDPSYSQETRNKIGRRLFDILGKQIFEFNAVHCDPHPGNFAFRPDGTIIIYDFGAIKRIDKHVIESLKEMLFAATTNNHPAIDQSLRDLGIRKDNQKFVTNGFYQEWIDAFLPPFAAEHFDFGTSDLHTQVMKLAKKSGLKHLDTFQPSAHTLLIDRVIGGHYWNLVKLEAAGNFKELTDKYTNKK